MCEVLGLMDNTVGGGEHSSWMVIALTKKEKGRISLRLMHIIELRGKHRENRLIRQARLSNKYYQKIYRNPQ